MDDENTRLMATRLLGRLFLLPGANLAAQIPSLFEAAFLGRLKDISANVRMCAIEQSVTLIQHKPTLAQPLLKALGERIFDSSDKVRAGCCCNAPSAPCQLAAVRTPLLSHTL